MKYKSEEAPINAQNCVRALWQEGIFKEGRTLLEVSNLINEKWDHNFLHSDISKALSKSDVLRRIGKKRSFKYIQKISPVSKKVATIESELFSDELIKIMDKDFKAELDDLHLNFGKSGDCTAFILRKILEKLIHNVFAQHGIRSKIEDKNQPGNLVGLEKMLSIAAQEKIKDIPILNASTARNIRGIKFLGDTSAHNPLTNVDMETILPQMPFIITAYKELIKRLS